MSNRVSIWFSAPLLGILAFHLICESMVIPILVPTLIEPSQTLHDMLPNFSDSARKFVYGFVLSVYPIALFFCAPLIGALSDKLGRKCVLIATLIGSILGCVAQGIAMESLSAGLLIFGRALVGITAGVDGTIQAALLEKCSGKTQKNFYLGATMLAMSLGLMLGPAFAALFINSEASNWAWSIPFFIIAVFFVFAMLALIFSMPDSGKLKKTKLSQIDWLGGLRDVGTLAKAKKSRVLISIFCFNQVGAGAFFAVVPLILASSCGFSPREIAAFLSVEGIFAGIVFAFLGPKLLEKISNRRALILGLWLSLLTIFLLLVSKNYWLMWSLTALQATGFSLTYFVMLAIFSESAPEGKRGWILSVLTSLWGLTMGLGLVLCGILAGFSNELCIVGCLIFSAVALFLAVRKKNAI